MELKTVDMIFVRLVQVLHSIFEIQAGQTPNPDILCHSCIKSGELLDIWCIPALKTSY
jgi:tRNA U34 2-thiouridine synthase MnmA/TrmU